MTVSFTPPNSTQMHTSLWSSSERWKETVPDSQSFSSDWFVEHGHQLPWNSCNQACKLLKRFFRFKTHKFCSFSATLKPPWSLQSSSYLTKNQTWFQRHMLWSTSVLSSSLSTSSFLHFFLEFTVRFSFHSTRKVNWMFLFVSDPFGPFENLFCALVFGGVWDSVAKLFGRGQVKEENKDAKKTN